MQDKLYSIQELTELLQLHEKTILRFIHEGKIKARKIGRAWKVSEYDLRTYVHGELATQRPIDRSVSYETIGERISCSCACEVADQSPEEAIRLSNSFIAMLNSKDDSWGKTRFEFSYDPDRRRAKYSFAGTPTFIAAIIKCFEILSNQEEEGKSD
jgi:excisionase family DNA binding protein